MNDFHQKILEARIKESNREWLVKRVLLVGILIILVFFGLLSMCSPSDEADRRSKTVSSFGMFSNASIGESKYAISNGGYDPSGLYRVVCNEGHGIFTANGMDYWLSADEYEGTEKYTKDTLVYLEQNDILSATSLHASSFRLEFFFEGEKTN